MKELGIPERAFDLLKANRLRVIMINTLNYFETGDIIKLTKHPIIGEKETHEVEVTHILHSETDNGIKQGWCAISVKPYESHSNQP